MKRILIVDDKPENLYLLRVLLQGHGYEVEEASQGEEALVKARHSPPHLVVSDLLMPVMDGYTLLRRWKADDRLKSVPFVVFTATYTEPQDEKLARELGADAFIIKPAEPELFLRQIEEVIHQVARSVPAPAEPAGKPLRLPVSAPEEEEVSYLHQFNSVLIDKLEHKLEQLEKVKRELERDVAERQRAAESLQMMQFCVENAGDGVFWLNPDGRLLYVNKSACQQLEYTSAELLGMSVFDLDPDFQPMIWPAHWEKLKRQHTMVFETRHRTKTGRIISVEVNASHVRVGKQDFNFAFTRDITQRKQAESALRESELLFRSLFEQAAVGVARVAPGGRWLDMNQRMCDIVGCTREELLGFNIQSLTHPEDLDADLQFMRRLVAGEIGSCYSMEKRYLRKDQTLVWANLTVSLVRDAADEPLYFVSVVEDITRRKHAEIARQERELELRLITNNIPGPVSRVDRDLRYRFVNDHYERIFGRPSASVVGRTMPEIMSPELFQHVEPYVQRVLAGETVAFESYTRMASGDVRPYLITYVPDFDREKRVVGFFVIGFDITERKQAEGALQESQALYSSLVEQMPAGVFRKDKEGRYVFVNATFCRLRAMTPEQFLGKTACELGLTDFALEQRGADHHAQIMKTGQAIEVEEVYPTADGGKQHLQVVKSPVFDHTGKIVGSQGIMFDVTRIKTAEAAVRKSQALYRSLVEQMPAGVFRKDAEGRYVMINSPFTRRGFKAEEILGKTAGELVAAERAQAGGARDEIIALLSLAMKHHEHIMRTGESIEVEEEYVDGHGAKRCLRVVKSPVFDDAGKIVGTQGIQLDITERKHAEQHVRQLNRVYSVLSDINQNIVREKNPQVLLAAACRTAVEKGQFPMAWIGMKDALTGRLQIHAHAGAKSDTLDILRSLVGGEQPDCAFTYQALRTGSHGVCNDVELDPQTASWREAALQRNYRAMASLPLKAGETTIGTFNLYADKPGFFDEEEMRLLDELAMDISFALEVSRRETDRRKVEDELRWKTAFFEAQVDSTPDGVLVVDSQGQRILQNQRMNELLKIPAHVTEDADSFARSQFVTGQTKNPQQFAEKIAYLRLHPDEASRDEIELTDGSVLFRTSFPVRDKAGKHYGRIWTFRDITKQRQLEEQFRQSQKLEAIGQLAGGVAHDFNNILAVIMMQVGLAGTDRSLAPETRETLNDIKAAAERAANLTRQLLAFSRRQVMRSRPLDLNEIVTNLTKMLQRILGEDVRLQLNLHSRPLMTRADAGMLDQVLLNLVINARDALPDGGQLFIETSEKTFTEEESATIPDALPGRHVCLRVTDTGSGIPAEHLARVFEPFFTTKEPGKGTGLGLSTVFGIVKQHGGSITVNSEVGKGTTFQIFLPATVVAPEAPEPSAAKPFPQGGTETILLAEDDPSVRMLTRILLERQGYKVIEAANGVEALKVAEQNPGKIQLLLTDIVMPEGVSGRDLATRLQKANPGLKVVFTSGYSVEIAGRELSLQEGQNFIQKPASPQQLMETVRRSLDGK